jgi:hypothetical protein
MGMFQIADHISIVRKWAGHGLNECISTLRLAILGQLFTDGKTRNIIVADVPYQAMILKNCELAGEIGMIVRVIGEHGSIWIPKAPILLEKHRFSTQWLASKVFPHLGKQFGH